ncbi:hypothetical protein ACWGOQ_0008300 [Aquimarina sp. M1]
MENQFYKSTGISLISGALLIIATMVLHPTGGNLEYIIKISTTIQVAHAIAIFSMPVILFGFYGLSMALLDTRRLSILAFIIISFGLIAAMFAAVFNGLTLPYFLNKYSGALDKNIDVLQSITNYGFAINIPLDYIFIIACCLSILVYSIIILLENSYPKWLGYFGILISVLTILGGLNDFLFTSLNGFRVFTFSIAAWILFSGALLLKYNPNK